MRRAIRIAIRAMAYSQIADGATFLLVAGNYGVDGETNPIVRFLWNAGPGGIVYVIAIKLAVIWWTLIMVRVTVLRKARVLALILLLFSATIGLVGAISNVVSFFILGGF